MQVQFRSLSPTLKTLGARTKSGFNVHSKTPQLDCFALRFGAAPDDFKAAVAHSGLPLHEILSRSIHDDNPDVGWGAEAPAFYPIPKEIPGFEQFGFRLSAPDFGLKDFSHLKFRPFKSKIKHVPNIGVVLGKIGPEIQVVRRMPGIPLRYYLFDSKPQTTAQDEDLADLKSTFVNRYAATKTLAQFFEEDRLGKRASAKARQEVSGWYHTQFQPGYAKLMHDLANLEPKHYTQFVDALVESDKNGITFDFAHSKNVLLCPKAGLSLIDHSECDKSSTDKPRVESVLKLMFEVQTNGLNGPQGWYGNAIQDALLRGEVCRNGKIILEKLQAACIQKGVNMVAPLPTFPAKGAWTFDKTVKGLGLPFPIIAELINRAPLDRTVARDTEATRVEHTVMMALEKIPYRPQYGWYFDGSDGLFTACGFTPDPGVVGEGLLHHTAA